MCGLLAFLSTQRQAASAKADVEDALRLMRHRGPDEGGAWSDDDVVLGFRRLSIIDIERSHQPLPYDDGRYWLLFNGEIYNYVELRARLTEEFGATFQTHGDGEAVLAAYKYLGEAGVTQLRGMFAFVIWDSVERTMFGARDWFGIKPLYTMTTARGVYFSSEEKSLQALSGTTVQAEPAALQQYLTLQYVPEPAAMTAGITRIESGTCFTVTPDGALTTRRYFRPTFPTEPVTDTAARWKEIGDVLADSVRVHMRADVTVGAFLSGGIDSTAIAALARQHNPKLLSFSVGFERAGYSEIDVAAETAQAIDVQHITTVVTPDEFAEALPLIVWYLDEPVADPALVPLYFVAREARKYVKVVLSGEGADELFGGYNIYHEPRSLRPFDAMPRPVKRSLHALSGRLPAGMRGKDLLRRGSIPIEERYYGNARIFRDDELGLLRTYDESISYRDVTRDHYAATRHLDPVTRMQYIDIHTWLRGDILVKADKMTMANSLELRVPFLDKEVFDVASRLPVEQRVTRHETKYALRQALRDVVPAHVLHRRKLGFPVPIRFWLREQLYDWARAIIDESGTDRLIDKDAVRALLDAHRVGPLDHSRKIWTLLVFMIWHGIFVEGRIRPDVPAPSYPVSL
ncbi:MAG: asparagine synthase (glutamine-hydrolyzing) [Mycobacteriales bacterium]|nr:MAG: asparagine synthase (glutamine-hydrolyzing) [Pseudonocardiales bacterium]